MAQESTTTKMVQYTMESGMKTRNAEEVRCSSLMAHTMMANGKEIKCMAWEYSSPAQGTDMKVISATG